MIAFIDKFRHSKYYEEKRRFLLFVFLLFSLLFLAGYLFQVAYARYEVNTKLNANIKKALYILGTDNLSFENINSLLLYEETMRRGRYALVSAATASITALFLLCT